MTKKRNLTLREVTLQLRAQPSSFSARQEMDKALDRYWPVLPYSNRVATWISDNVQAARKDIQQPFGGSLINLVQDDFAELLGKTERMAKTAHERSTFRSLDMEPIGLEPPGNQRMENHRIDRLRINILNLWIMQAHEHRPDDLVSDEDVKNAAVLIGRDINDTYIRAVKAHQHPWAAVAAETLGTDLAALPAEIQGLVLANIPDIPIRRALAAGIRTERMFTTFRYVQRVRGVQDDEGLRHAR